MANPLFNALGGGMPAMPNPMGQFGQMMQQFQQFRANFQGDPKAEVQKLLQSGKMHLFVQKRRFRIMAEFSNSNTVIVAAGENLPLTETAVKAPACIVHREGSGLVTLRGLTSGQCRARFKVSFGGNIAIPTGGTVGPVSVALAVGGEALNSATAIVTPAAVENYFNVFVAAFIEVPRGCCLTVAVKNTGTQAVSIANSNLIVERVA